MNAQGGRKVSFVRPWNAKSIVFTISLVCLLFFLLKSTNKSVLKALYFDIHKWWKNSDNPKLKIKRQRAIEVSDSAKRCS